VIATEEPTHYAEAERVLRTVVQRDHENPLSPGTSSASSTTARATMAAPASPPPSATASTGELRMAMVSAQAAMAGIKTGSPGLDRAQDILLASRAELERAGRRAASRRATKRPAVNAPRSPALRRDMAVHGARRGGGWLNLSWRRGRGLAIGAAAMLYFARPAATRGARACATHLAEPEILPKAMEELERKQAPAVGRGARSSSAVRRRWAARADGDVVLVDFSIMPVAIAGRATKRSTGCWPRTRS
jgi:hypothetical protein